LAKRMRRDGRNLSEPASVAGLGIEYHGIGREG
jgi:hypothetical protein